MPSKIKTVRVCLLIQAWLSVVTTIIFALIFALGGLGISLSGEESSGLAGLFFGAFGLIFALAGIAIAILYFVTAKGVTNKKGWAKIVAIVLAVLALSSVPIGTVLGIFILISIFDEESNLWFEPQK